MPVRRLKNRLSDLSLMQHHKGFIGLLAFSLAAIAIMAGLGPPSNLFIVAVALALALAALVLAFNAPERTLARAYPVVLALGLGCFAATMAEELLLGGTPINGKITELGYFVGSHGHYREVSQGVYRFSLVFNIGLILSWPTMMGFILVSSALRPWRSRKQSL